MTHFYEHAARAQEELLAGALRSLGRASTSEARLAVPPAFGWAGGEDAARALRRLERRGRVLVEVPGGRGRATVWAWVPGAPEPDPDPCRWCSHVSPAVLTALEEAARPEDPEVARLRAQLAVERERSRLLAASVRHLSKAHSHQSAAFRHLLNVISRDAEPADRWGPLGR